MMKKNSVYFLYNKSLRRSYIGFTNTIKIYDENKVSCRRWRQHQGQIKGGAKAIKNWENFKCLAFIHGFTTKNKALSFEWFAKRRKMKCHTFAYPSNFIQNNIVPKRLFKFFAPICLKKFKDMELELYFHDETYMNVFEDVFRKYPKHLFDAPQFH